MGSLNFNEKMPKVKRSTQKGGASLSKSGENQVEMYKKEMDTKARNVLCTIIPEKLDYLCRILDQEMWQPEYCINSIGEYEEKVKEIEELKKAQAQEEEAAEEDVEENAEDNEEVPEGEEQKEGKVEKLEGEPEEKKPKTSSSNASTLSIELKEKKSLSDIPMPKIECNKIVLGQMEIVKPELINLGINCQILRDWIHLHIPKHEDGNNFGVEVQEEALQELQAVKEESQSAMEEHAAYHLARANIMEKILQEGNIKDLKIFIYEEDEKQSRRLRMTAQTLRTHYTTILDTITKNFDKITNPKGSDSNHTLMY